VALIVGFARAVELCLADLEAEAERLRGLRDRLWRQLEAALPGLRRNGQPDRRLPGNLNVCFAGVEADALLARIEGVALSSGSACASARGEPSHVLRALGLPDALARAALRFGLGRSTTPEQIDFAAAQVILRVREARAARAGAEPARRLSSQ
jgi:cysteine desulfurase